MYDAVIIGAGMSGLAAGIRMAHYDKKVCILERHKMIGGLNSYYRQGGRNYDVGLHALTNYAKKGAKTGPLVRLLRHLRMKWEELALIPQIGSSVAFPGMRLHFTNDIAHLEAEIRKKFPSQIDGFRRMIGELADYDQLGLGASGGSARQFVSRHLTDPLLIEMLFCPLLFYGGARENDMEFGQFCIMFRSIFLEGFSRPYNGVRLILQKLLDRFKRLGGELRLRSGVRQIVAKDSTARKIILDDGSEIEAKNIVSSAGWRETMNLCQVQQHSPQIPSGQLSFIETISVLDTQPKKFGHEKTIVFYNDSPVFTYKKPQQPVDLRSGVICSPNNFAYDKPLGEGMVRITSLANHDCWVSLDEEAYRLEKHRAYDRAVESAVRFIPDFRRHVIDTDMFTPLTIRRFTGHENGAIYGAPEKKYDGRTHLDNLFVCGTDQGMVGIIGSIVSGITIANKYLLGGNL
ncbi:MAG: NAD(P)/FAD-dependent oxidoreductase [Planctomycetaceae bacterium]|jgi:phytoene dehydrogenase-like protein|nr:NAD(P)/FAD-dependent oxidoreductase [Planctomycetaceae bacterium]